MADLVPTTWNPADKDATVTLSGSDLTAASTAGGVRSVFGATSGKYYWEITVPDNVGQMVGVGTEDYNTGGWPGSDSESLAFDVSAGIFYTGAASVATLSGYTGVSVISVLLDADTKFIQLLLDGDALGGLLGSSLAGTTGTVLYAAFGYAGSATANFGDTPFVYTPPVGYEAGFGLDPDQFLPVSGVNVLSAGSPSVIRGPNQVTDVTGLAALKVGAPVVQLGYPETLLPSGASVFSAGAPTLLPYSHRTVPVAGASLFQAGYPTIGYNPIVGGTEFIAPNGVSVLSAGTPALSAASSVQVSGVSVFSAGSPSLHTGLGVSGSALLSAGTPTIGVGVGAAGVSLLRAGTPQLNVTVQPQGRAVLNAGLPSLIAGEYIVQPTGAAVFTAGTPRISNMTIHPWGKSHFRAGTPKLVRGTKC